MQFFKMSPVMFILQCITGTKKIATELDLLIFWFDLFLLYSGRILISSFCFLQCSCQVLEQDYTEL